MHPTPCIVIFFFRHVNFACLRCSSFGSGQRFLRLAVRTYKKTVRSYGFVLNPQGFLDCCQITQYRHDIDDNHGKVPIETSMDYDVIWDYWELYDTSYRFIDEDVKMQIGYPGEINNNDLARLASPMEWLSDNNVSFVYSW